MGERFGTTRWSLVQAAADSQSPGYHDSLAWLCRAYWPPVYSFIRSRGKDEDSARDLTQSFFTQLLDKRFLKGLQGNRGRFRSFLLVCVKHYMADVWDHEHAQKRGGGLPHLQLDIADAESALMIGPADLRTPDKAFEKQWAYTVLQRALSRLEAESKLDPTRFRSLRPYLTGDDSGTSYREAAEKLGMSEGSFKVAVHNLRKKLGKILRDEVSQTVRDPGQVEEELRFLLLALGN